MGRHAAQIKSRQPPHREFQPVTPARAGAAELGGCAAIHATRETTMELPGKFQRSQRGTFQPGVT